MPLELVKPWRTVLVLGDIGAGDLMHEWIRTLTLPARRDIVIVLEIVSVVIAGAERTLEVIGGFGRRGSIYNWY